MKKILVIFLLSCGIALMPYAQTIAASVYQSTQGYIILRVEKNGEAYYVHPTQKLLFPLQSPKEAFSVLRSQGVGITNENLNKIPTRTAKNDAKIALKNSFFQKQKGKIFLQVQSKGEAWYINPRNGTREYLSTPQDALAVMKTVGLGISEKNFELLEKEASYLSQNTEAIAYLSRAWDAYKNLDSFYASGKLKDFSNKDFENLGVMKDAKPTADYYLNPSTVDQDTIRASDTMVNLYYKKNTPPYLKQFTKRVNPTNPWDGSGSFTVNFMPLSLNSLLKEKTAAARIVREEACDTATCIVLSYEKEGQLASFWVRKNDYRVVRVEADAPIFKGTLREEYVYNGKEIFPRVIALSIKDKETGYRLTWQIAAIDTFNRNAKIPQEVLDNFSNPYYRGPQ